MLKAMRKNMKVVMWLLLATFVLWGGSSAIFSGSKTTNYAGTVFNKKIDWKEYDQNFSAVQNQAMLMYGEKFSQIKQYLNLEAETWSRIVLLETANKKHIRVSDNEVISTICNMPLFQDPSGKFMPDAYRRITDYFLKVPAREFEEEIKGSLKIAKLRDSIIKDVSISDSELKEAYKLKNEKVNADYALINADDFKSQAALTDDILKQFYQLHAQEFITPLRISIEYIPFEYEQYKNNINITPEEIDKYYETRKKDFQKELDDAKKKGTPEQDAVSSIKTHIKKLLIDKKAQDKADDASSSVSYELAQTQHPDFSAVAKKFNMPVKESGFFSMEESIPGIGLSYAVAYEAFKLEPGQVSNPIKAATGRYIIKLKGKKEPYVPSFDEVKQKIRDIVTLQESKTLAAKKADEFLSTIKQKMGSGASFKQACAELKLDIKSTGLFSRQDNISNIGKSEEFANMAFSGEAGKLAGIAKVSSGAAIIFATEKTGIDEEKFKNEKEQFKNTVLEEKQNTYFQDWFKKLKEKADVKIAVSAKDRAQQRTSQQSTHDHPMDDF